MREGWVEPLSLFTLVAMPSGSRKSVVFEAATAPLQAQQRDAIAAQVVSPRVAEAAVALDVGPDHRLRLVVDGDTVESRTVTTAVAPPSTTVGPHGTSDAEPVPRGRKLFVGDVTPERIGGLLAENGGRIAILSDEGEVCEVIAGRYGGSSVEVLLKGHSGAPISIERVGREPVHADSPSLVMGLAVQPDVLRKLAGKRVLRERGLLARFMVAVPKSNLGFRKVNSLPVPKAVRSEYEARVRALLGFSEGSAHDASAPQYSAPQVPPQRALARERPVPG